MSLEYALSKWDEVKQGKRVIFSAETLDALTDEFHARPAADADAKLFSITLCRSGIPSASASAMRTSAI